MYCPALLSQNTRAERMTKEDALIGPPGLTLLPLPVALLALVACTVLAPLVRFLLQRRRKDN